MDNLNTLRNDRKLHKREVNDNRKINTMSNIYIHTVYLKTRYMDTLFNYLEYIYIYIYIYIFSIIRLFTIRF